MKSLNVMLVALFLTIAVHRAAPQASAPRPWSAAKYHGLTVGTSSRADVLKLLGKPRYVGREEDTGTPMMTYAVADPLPGTLSVYFKKDILTGMRLDLKKSLKVDEVVRLFGHDFVVAHYETDDCLDDGGAAPIYQSPTGPIKYMEYRDRGVAASFAYDDDQTVDAIVFTFEAFGPTHSQCAGRSHVSPYLTRQ